MLKAIGIILLFCCVAFANAECVGTSITCWPTQTSISKNSLFILSFYGYSQRLVAKLDKEHSIYLQSEDQKIQLRITEINKGDFEITQVVLTPSKQLSSGRIYEIVIQGVSFFEKIEKWNPVSQKIEKARWIVTDSVDNEKPKWLDPPVYVSKTMVEYGCGPAKWVNFSFRCQDNSPILVKATLKNLKTLKVSTYYLEPKENIIKVGHGMCSGAFHFDDSSDYEVSFTLMDQSGNFSLITSKPFKFSQPVTLTETE